MRRESFMSRPKKLSKVSIGRDSDNRKVASVDPILNRRSAITLAGAAAALGLTGGTSTEAKAASSIKILKNVKFSGEPDLRHAPQFFVGNPKAEFQIEVAWSIRCSYTQKLYLGGLGALVKKVSERKDALIVFHHLARNSKEWPHAENLLAVEPEYYGPLCIKVLDDFSKKQKIPSAQEIYSLVWGSELPKDVKFDREKALTSIALLNIYLYEYEKVTETPAIRFKGEWIMDADPTSLREILREANYEI